VCDFSDSVTVDNCVNCRFIFVPIQSSIFLRNCKGCKCIIACQQFRTRDCEDSDIFLYSLTGPIIESSTRLRFACFQLYYPALAEQFAKAKLDVISNIWSAVYDFTPGENHWSFLPKDVTPTSYFKPLPPPVLPSVMGVTAGRSNPETQHKSVVPLTWGNRPKPYSQSCLVAVYHSHKDRVADFCNSLEGDKFVATQIVEKVVTTEILENAASAHLKEPVIAIEINGEDVVPYVQKFAADFAVRHNTPLTDLMYVSPSEEIAKEQVNRIFEQVAIEI